MLDPRDPTTRVALGRIGETLRGKWHLDSLLGVGGMACVYAATHRNGSRGAVKILHREKSREPTTRERFLREGYVANRVAHPGVVAVLDDDVAEDGSIYMVMELLEGESLGERAAPRPGHRLNVPEVLDIGDQLLDVLAAAHDQGIVHRDLKPDNLFWTRAGRLKVLDFGIARFRDALETTERTRTGSVFGTPAFMPPEQALGEVDQINALTDVWATGATLFTLAAGRKVREAESANKLLLLAMTQPAPPLASVAPDLPAPLAAVIDRALALDQRDRWPDARAMQRAIRDLASTPAVTLSGLGPAGARMTQPIAPPAAAPQAPPNPVFAAPAPSSAVPMPTPPIYPAAFPAAPIASAAPVTVALSAPHAGLAPPIAAEPAAQPWARGEAPAQPTASPISRDAAPAPARSGNALVIGGAIAALTVGAIGAAWIFRPAAGSAPSAPSSAVAASAAPITSITPSAAPAEPSSAPSATASPSAEASSAAPPSAMPSTPASKAPPIKGKGTKKDPWAKF